MVTARQNADELEALAAERTRLTEGLRLQVRDSLQGSSGLLREASEYLLDRPGKLLRPLLMLEACRAAGGDPELVFPAAVGTEYGHLASLVHDDIIDGDGERHGKASLHKQFDTATGILTGDLLIFQTFLMFARCVSVGADAERVVAAVHALSTTCIEVCRGQALEAAIAGNLATTEDTYLEMIRLKTASVCRAAAYIGAHLGGADREASNVVAAYGEALGLAFQIVDDVLSYVGDAQVVGKSLRSDLDNHRVTLPLIYALEIGRLPIQQRIVSLFATAPTSRSHRQLAELLLTTRALDRARALAFRYTQQAKEQLDHLPLSPARERLRRLADVFVARDH